MAKKSGAGRQAGASRRSTTSREQRVTFVRAPGASATTVNDERAKAPTPATPSQPTAKPSGPAKTPAVASKPTATQPQRAARPTAPSAPAARPNAPSSRPPTARAPQRPVRPSTRARAADVVTAEHYGYVKNDLILIGTLAACAFVVLIVIYFYLRAQGQV